MRDALHGALEHYDRVVIPCAGRFTLAEAAVDAGWDASKLHLSDITPFSSLIGYMAAGKDLNGLGVTFAPETDDLRARARERTILVTKADRNRLR